jgi:hypothetical protein
VRALPVGFIEQVKAAAASELPDLAAQAGYRWPARSRTRSGKLHCAFHADETPSAHLYEDRIHCFGCGESRDVIDLEQLARSGTFTEALYRLAHRHGIQADGVDVPVRPRFTTETLAEAELFRTGLIWHLERELEAAKLPLLEGPGEVDGERIFSFTQILADVQQWTEHDAAEAFLQLKSKHPEFVAELGTEAEHTQAPSMSILYFAGQSPEVSA